MIDFWLLEKTAHFRHSSKPFFVDTARSAAFVECLPFFRNVDRGVHVFTASRNFFYAIHCFRWHLFYQAHAGSNDSDADKKCTDAHAMVELASDEYINASNIKT